MPSPSQPIPSLGLGTWDLRGADCVRAVREALEIGYRHIDTAQMYENEREVGRGLSESDVEREHVFVTTKLWYDSLTGKAVPAQFDKSLKRLGNDYVDLLLIHSSEFARVSRFTRWRAVRRRHQQRDARHSPERRPQLARRARFDRLASVAMVWALAVVPG